jgi:hypothetical protein
LYLQQYLSYVDANFTSTNDLFSRQTSWDHFGLDVRFPSSIVRARAKFKLQTLAGKTKRKGAAAEAAAVLCCVV